MGPGCLLLPHTIPRLWPRPQTSEEPFQGPRSTSQVTLPRNPYRPNAAYQAHKGRVQHVHQDLYEHGLVLRHKLITLLGKQQCGVEVGPGRVWGAGRALLPEFLALPAQWAQGLPACPGDTPTPTCSCSFPPSGST